MKRLLTCLLLLPPAHACGPWFPDSILDQPQAILDVPPVCYEDELETLFPEPATHTYPPFGKDVEDLVAEENLGADENAPLMQQLPWEVAELVEWWKSQKLEPGEVAKRAKQYIALRRPQLLAVRAVDFRSVQLAENPVPSPVDANLADILPPDVLDFTKASQLLIAGRTAEAREIWKSITARPAKGKKFRGAWAAWMLAKTSDNQAETLAGYQATIDEVAAGAKDCLLLAPAAAAAWLGPRQQDPVRRLHLLAHAWHQGHRQALIDLRRTLSGLLEQSTDDEFALLARDPLSRQLLNIQIFARLDGPRLSSWWDNEEEDKAPFPHAKWLQALEAHGPSTIERADRLAWALYASGEYEAAKRWLAMADPAEPRSLWLKAKFAVREGKIDLADRSLARAVAQSRRQADWNPHNTAIEELYFQDAEFLRQAEQGRMLSDAAILKMARGEFIAALDHLVEANYTIDAAYVAENVLTTDELVSLVQKKAPQWSPGLVGWWEGKHPNNPAPLEAGPKGEGMNDTDYLAFANTWGNLRYLLARRLAREFRFREAREFMPTPMLPLYDHFVSLHRAARSGKYLGNDLAAIQWEHAVLTRRFGMELLGTEGAPDGRYYRGGSYDSRDFLILRRHRNGWKSYWDMKDLENGPPVPLIGLPPQRVARPSVLAEEIRRAEAHAVSPRKRFHYRYTAAELAWKAAANLPDNTNSKAYMLNTAGLWLATRDPESADRFYKALVRKNWTTELGQAADRNRWFLSLDAPPDLPQLPAGLQP